MELNIEYVLQIYKDTVAELNQRNIILTVQVKQLEEELAKARKEQNENQR